jgi:hypothetical protein
MSVLMQAARKRRSSKTPMKDPSARRTRVRVPEAPETAVRPGEQPETKYVQAVEAPDAGVEAGHYLENMFTHGRSKS